MVQVEPIPVMVDFDAPEDELDILEEEEILPEPIVFTPAAESDLEIVVEVKPQEEELSEAEFAKKIKDFGEYDPTLELSRYKMPTLDLLNDYGQSNITIDQEELEANKNRIVETLNNYKLTLLK